MPFTPSHVAAALPFLKTPLLPAVVVIGTMAPDIPYYVPLFVPRELSHSLLGLVTVDLLIAVACAFLWWFVLREPVVDLVPRAIGSRIPAVGRMAWRPVGWNWPLSVAVLLLSALVGGATHLLWDSFTHPGWVVDHLAVLRVQLGPLAVDKWLQHASSVAGLLIVAVWTVRRLRTTAPDAGRASRVRPSTRYGAWVIVAAAGVGAGLAVWIPGMAGGLSALDPGLVFLVARVGIGVAGLAVALIVVGWYLARRRAPDSGP